MQFLKISISVLFASALFFAGYWSNSDCPRYNSAEEHWAELRRSIDGVYELKDEDSAAGLSHPSFKLDYHLNRLLEMNELSYRQFIFPKISRGSLSLNVIDEEEFSEAGAVWALSSHQVNSLGENVAEDPICFDIWYYPESEESIAEYVEGLYRKLDI